MKKIYSQKKYKLFIAIRQRYQAKRQPKRFRKKKKNGLEYISFELNCQNIDNIIRDTYYLTKFQKCDIDFRRLKDINLGLCLLYVSLLSSCNRSFSLNPRLLPEKKEVREKMLKTGLLDLLCKEKVECNDSGRIKILKFTSIKEQIVEILLQIRDNLINYALGFYQLNCIELEQRRRNLQKVFSEVLVNIAEHAEIKNSTIYLAGEISDGFIKFAILDQGIGFKKSIQAHFGKWDMIKDLSKEMVLEFRLLNYVKMVFENEKDSLHQYSGLLIRRGNGTRRLKETICAYKKSKLQILSKNDYYEIIDGKVQDNRVGITHNAVGTLIYFELPVFDT